VLALLCPASIAVPGEDSRANSVSVAAPDTLSSHATPRTKSDTLPWILMGATLFIVLALTRRRHIKIPDE